MRNALCTCAGFCFGAAALTSPIVDPTAHGGAAFLFGAAGIILMTIASFGVNN